MKKRNVLDDEAVSPVIATILMVAITVVLAATLYMMLPSGGGGGSQQSGSFGSGDEMVDTDKYEIPFAKFSPERSITELQFSLEVNETSSSTASFLEDDTGTEPTVNFDTPLSDYNMTYRDQTNNQVVNQGDSVVIGNEAGSLAGSYELTVLYDGDQVDSISWTV